jgi:hypothetical protein
LTVNVLAGDDFCRGFKGARGEAEQGRAGERGRGEEEKK